MPNLSSNLVDNLARDISKNESKDYIKKCLECTEKSCITKCKDTECFLEYK